MAKLPGEPDLGPTPGIGPRPVASVDVSGFARGGQALAEGIRTAGAGLAKVGQGIGEFTLDRNRWDYAKAHAQLATGAIDVSEDLAKDRNYSNDASGKAMPARYADRYKQLQSSSAELIQDPRMRERFISQTAPLVEQHVKRAEDHARNLENNASVAYVEQQGDNIINKAVASPDDATRTQLIEAHTRLIDGLVAKGAKTPTEGVAMKQAWAHQYATADGLAAVNSGDPARIEGAINRLRQPPGSPDDITAHILRIEGEGQNPRSSAVGAGQFTNSTWLDMIRKNRPDLAQGRSDAEILAMRADRGLGRAMTEAYRAENERYLRNQGIEATPGAQYLAHFLGPKGAAAVLQANPGQPVEAALASAVGPEKARAMIAANPEVLRGQLAGSVTHWADVKMGGTGGQSGHIYDILKPEVRQQLIAHGETQMQALGRAGAADDERARRMAEAQQKAIAQGIEDEYLKDSYGPNPTKTAADAANDPRLEGDPATKLKIISLVERANKPDPISRVSQATTMEFIDRMRKPEGDPLKLTDRNEITDAYLKGGMSRGDYEWTLKQFDDARGGGDSYSKSRADFVKRVIEPQITKSDISTGLNNTRVGQRAYEFEQAMDRKKEAMLKEGKNPLDMFDPTKPDYMGKEEVLKPLRRTAQRDMNDMLNEEAENAGLPAKAAPLPAEPKAAKDLAQLQAMVRANPTLRETAIQIATERGWVATKPKTVAPTIPMSQ